MARLCTFLALAATRSSCVSSRTRCCPSRYDAQYTTTLSVRVLSVLSRCSAGRSSGIFAATGAGGAGAASVSLSSGNKAFENETVLSQSFHLNENRSCSTSVTSKLQFANALPNTSLRCFLESFISTSKVPAPSSLLSTRLPPFFLRCLLSRSLRLGGAGDMTLLRRIV